MTAVSASDRLEPQAWMSAPETRAVIAALSAEGAEVRFVGGCVRDALAGRPVKDVDLATPDRPEQVMALLQAAGIKAVPTGIDHGTVTAVSGHRPFEITTLREDVETDGRRARVAFTDDWQADAARRDLTFNAMSCTADGRLFDPFGGRDDLAAGRVRFVGDPRDRIQEDYLRLLRFFRFQAYYGRVPPDAETLAVARELAPRLSGLSGERIRSELLRLLAAPDALAVLDLMIGQGLLESILPEIIGISVLRCLLTLDMAEVADDPVLHLAALLPPGAAVARAVAQRLRLSNAEAAELEMLDAPPPELTAAAAVLTEEGEAPKPRRALSVALYRFGPAKLRASLAIACARLLAEAPDKAAPATAGLQAALAVAAAWRDRDFPLTGADVLDLGVTAGPDIGSLLRAVEDWWVGEDFAPDRTACLARLRDLAASQAPGG